MNIENFTIKCIPIIQPIGEFYIGVIPYNILLEMCHSDVRRMNDNMIDDEFIGIQRPLNDDRIKEIKKYVETIDATFPTAITLHLKSEFIISFDLEKSELTVMKTEKTFKILDGQHRVYGLSEFKGSQFDLNIVIFIDLDTEEQAMVFSTINLKQTKVSKSLVYDLYEYTQSRSPQKSCHNIAKLINRDSSTPYYNKIKILGTVQNKGDKGYITQARFVEDLLPLITEDPVRDRNILKKYKSEKEAKDELEKIKFSKPQLLVYREYFINNNDNDIYISIKNYFTALKIHFKDSWHESSVLTKSIGFSALIRILQLINVKYSNNTKEPFTVDDYLSILTKFSINGVDFSINKFSLGRKGEKELFDILFKIL